MHKTIGLMLLPAMLASSPRLLAQAEGSEKISANAIVEAPYEPDYAKGLPERQEWRRLRKTFLKKKLPLILRKHRDRLRCGTCMDVYMDVAFSVSFIGAVNVLKIDAQHACGAEFPPAMRDDFIAYLREYPYPKALLGKTVRLRLGTALKC